MKRKNEKIEETSQTVHTKKKNSIARMIINSIVSILFVVILAEAVIGFVNMQKISNDEKPVWYLSTKTTESELKTVTEYNLGLYKIIKVDTAKETKTTLKLFFLNN